MQVLQLSLSTVPSSQHHHKEERSEHIVATMVHIFSKKLNQLPSDFCFLSVDIIIFLVLFSQFLFSVQLLSSLCHFTTSKNITIVFLFFFLYMHPETLVSAQSCPYLAVYHAGCYNWLFVKVASKRICTGD